jgi:hypothetical protein
MRVGEAACDNHSGGLGEYDTIHVVVLLIGRLSLHLGRRILE